MFNEKLLLSDTDRARLVRLLGMLSSSFDAERATAGSLADRFIRERDLTWEHIVVHGVTPQHDPNRRSSPARTWRDVVVECQQHSEQLTDWEIKFLGSIATWRGIPTPKQRAKLDDIAERLGVEPAP